MAVDQDLTAGLAEQAATLAFAHLPDSVVTVARQGVLDTVGVALAARHEPVVRTLVDAWGDELAPGESSLLDGSGRAVSAASAALVNGTAAHALDFDDMHPAMIGHPSAPLVPAVLALAEELGASGQEVLTALVVGYEVQCRIGAAITPGHYRRGFHPTGTVATIGVAAAAGRLLGLDPVRMATALGIAVTQAAGLKSMFGTMCKPLHSGKAAANGIFAAKLAARGFTSAQDALACAQGFFAAQADDVDRDVVASRFGDPWFTLGIVFKLHAACGFTHSVIESMLAARSGLEAGTVDRVDLLVHPEMLSAADIRNPTTPLEAKFSVRLVTAMALVRGSVAARDFTPALLVDRELAEFSRRVSVRAETDEGRLHRLESIATVTTLDGARSTFTHNASVPLWTDDPAGQWERLRDKFEGLIDPMAGDAGQLVGQVERISAMADIRPLVRGLAT